MDGVAGTNWDAQSRYYNGVEDENGVGADGNINFGSEKNPFVRPFEKVTAAPDMYELHYNEDPFHFESKYQAKMMPEGTKMVPRVFKTNVGDIFTTNMIFEADIKLGDVVSPRTEDGVLSRDTGDGTIEWQVVKVYTMPDRQKGVKLMRIA